jgi:hypothetical protein
MREELLALEARQKSLQPLVARRMKRRKEGRS